MSKDNNYMKVLLNGLKLYIDEKTSKEIDIDIPKIKNANWSQNDSNESDYIIDRPFYSEDVIKTVLIDNVEVEYSDTQEMGTKTFYLHQYILEGSKAFVFDMDAVYKVTIDDMEYICKPYYNADLTGGVEIPLIGAGVDTSADDYAIALFGEYPFMIMAGTYNGRTACGIMILHEYETLILSLEEIKQTHHKLDKKYLPVPEWIYPEEYPVLVYKLINVGSNDTTNIYAGINFKYEDFQTITPGGEYLVHINGDESRLTAKQIIASSDEESETIGFLGNGYLFAQYYEALGESGTLSGDIEDTGEDYFITIHMAECVVLTTLDLEIYDFALTSCKPLYSPIPKEHLSPVLNAKNIASSTATIGQVIRVKSVDSNGTPTEWEAVNVYTAEEIDAKLEALNTELSKLTTTVAYIDENNTTDVLTFDISENAELIGGNA